jgi:hypothetical protein
MSSVPRFENTSSGSMNVFGNKEKEGLEGKTTSTDVNKDISVTGSSSAGSINTAPSPKQQQKPASSGTFTNLQQYAQANQGGAQKIAQSVTQNISQQGRQVQQQAGQQAARTQSDIAENKRKIEAEKEFASKQLERAGSTLTDETERQAYEQSKLKDKFEEFNTKRQELLAKQLEQDAQQKQLGDLQKEYNLDYVYNPSEEEFKRFRDIVTGQTQFNQVRDLDLSNQMIASQQLQQQAQQAGTDTGRMALLRQMLGQGREYTRGQTALDTALLAKDAQARQALQQGVQQTAEQTQQAVQGISGDVSAKRQALQALNTRFGSDIMTEGGTATTGVTTAVENAMKDLQADRKLLAAQLGTTEEQAGKILQQLSSRAGSLSSSLGTDWGLKMGGITGWGQGVQDLYKDNRDAIGLTGYDTKGITQTELNALKNAIYNPNVSLYGNRWASNPYDKSGAYSWDVSWDQGRWVEGLARKQAGDIAAASAALKKTTAEDAIARQLVMQGADPSGLGANELYKQLKEGKDIDRETAASIEQYRRYNALQDLLKGRDIGERSLRMSEAEKKAGKAAEQEALLRQARAEAMRKFKIQGE